MRKLGIMLITFTLIASSLACCFSGFYPVRGSGQMEEKEYQVEDFDGVYMSNQGDLTIEYGDEEELVIEAEENLLPHLEVRVLNHTLHIGTRPNAHLRPTRPIKYHLTVTELNSIELTGSGNVDGPVMEGDDISLRVTGSGNAALDGIDADDSVEIEVTGSGKVRVTGDEADGVSLRGDRLHVTISGSGDADLGELEADRIEVRITGSGALTVEGGRVEDQTISASGSGVYRARDLESATADVDISGSGNVTIRVDEELEASVTGSGDLNYIGDPTVQKKISSSGDVKCLDE